MAEPAFPVENDSRRRFIPRRRNNPATAEAARGGPDVVATAALIEIPPRRSYRRASSGVFGELGMGAEPKSNTAFIADVCTLITFISFVIIYTNIVYTIGVYSIIAQALGNFPPVNWLLAAIFYSPIALAAVVLWEFVRTQSSRHIAEADSARKLEFLDGVWIAGKFIGTIVFVLVLSAFVAYQANDILAEIAPPISQALAGLLGVTP
jgi:hypothetical protein